MKSCCKIHKAAPAWLGQHALFQRQHRNGRQGPGRRCVSLTRCKAGNGRACGKLSSAPLLSKCVQILKNKLNTSQRKQYAGELTVSRSAMLPTTLVRHTLQRKVFSSLLPSLTVILRLFVTT